jgi:hypothetical protein
VEQSKRHPQLQMPLLNRLYTVMYGVKADAECFTLGKRHGSPVPYLGEPQHIFTSTPRWRMMLPEVTVFLLGQCKRNRENHGSISCSERGVRESGTQLAVSGTYLTFPSGKPTLNLIEGEGVSHESPGSGLVHFT